MTVYPNCIACIVNVTFNIKEIKDVIQKSKQTICWNVLTWTVGESRSSIICSSDAHAECANRFWFVWKLRRKLCTHLRCFSFLQLLYNFCHCGSPVSVWNRKRRELERCQNSSKKKLKSWSFNRLFPVKRQCLLIINNINNRHYQCLAKKIYNLDPWFLEFEWTY